MSKFEKWWNAQINVKVFSLFKNYYPDKSWQYENHTTNLAWLTWQAATAESDKLIKELKDEVSVLREAVKENQFLYPANLDKYKSVTFSDLPYGQMIMSSEVVKWLCINRAKDYFEEMERINK